MKKLTRWFALGVALAASSTMALATTITDNGVPVVPSGLSSIPGTLLNSTSGSISTSTFSATYTDEVYENNMFCATCLTFVMQVTNSAGSSDSLVEVATGNGNGTFSPYSVDVDYLTGSGDNGTGSNPYSATETSSTVNFNFYTVPAGKDTDTLIIETNATTYSAGTLTAQDSTSGFGPAFVPGSLTPEPNSLLLLGTGLVSAAGLLYTRRIRSARV